MSATVNLKFAERRGFTLIEMAIVLAILGIILGSLIAPISAQIDQANNNETRQRIALISDALIGFVILNGRLPCPASATSNGTESFASGGNTSNGLCANFNNGFVPASTLGLSDLDSQGQLTDAWNNRIHYAVTAGDNNAFTKTNGLSLNSNADLMICATASSSTSTCSVANSIMAANIPVVIYSTGKNGNLAGTGLDEAENPNPNSTDNDRIFVSHTVTANTAGNGEFDDLVTWISPNILMGRLVAAGKLP